MSRARAPPGRFWGGREQYGLRSPNPLRSVALLAVQEVQMFDEFLDRLIARLMAGAGLVMAAAIAAVAGAMAVFAFLTPKVGAAWAYVIVAAFAAGVVAVWSFLQKSHRARTRQPSIDERVLEMLRKHPTASFMAGLAAASLLKGKPSEAARLWRGRKGKSDHCR